MLRSQLEGVSLAQEVVVTSCIISNDILKCTEGRAREDE